MALPSFFLTTALFNQLVDPHTGGIQKSELSAISGERPASAGGSRQLLSDGPPRNLLHVYGPTETTTFATWYSVTQVAEDAVIVPIGRPIANTQIYLLDNFLHPSTFCGCDRRDSYRRRRAGSGVPQASGSHGREIHSQPL